MMQPEQDRDFVSLEEDQDAYRVDVGEGDPASAPEKVYSSADENPDRSRFSGNTNGISPKFIASIAAAMVTALTTQVILDLPAWADLILLVGGVGLAVFQAGPGEVDYSTE